MKFSISSSVYDNQRPAIFSLHLYHSKTENWKPYEYSGPSELEWRSSCWTRPSAPILRTTQTTFAKSHRFSFKIRTTNDGNRHSLVRYLYILSLKQGSMKTDLEGPFVGIWSKEHGLVFVYVSKQLGCRAPDLMMNLKSSGSFTKFCTDSSSEYLWAKMSWLDQTEE